MIDNIIATTDDAITEEQMLRFGCPAAQLFRHGFGLSSGRVRGAGGWWGWSVGVGEGAWSVVVWVFSGSVQAKSHLFSTRAHRHASYRCCLLQVIQLSLFRYIIIIIISSTCIIF